MSITESELERRLKSEQDELFKIHRINEKLMTECDSYHFERDQWREIAERLLVYAQHLPHCGQTSYGITGDCDCSLNNAKQEFDRLKEDSK